MNQGYLAAVNLFCVGDLRGSRVVDGPMRRAERPLSKDGQLGRKRHKYRRKTKSYVLIGDFLPAVALSVTRAQQANHRTSD